MFLKYFFKNWKFIAIASMLFLAVCAAVLSTWFFLTNNDHDIPLVESESVIEPEPETIPPPSEDLSFLLERLNAPLSLTSEEIEEETRINEEQVKHARDWLESPDPQERINGAEQLSAYPTAQAEKLLVKALLNDLDSEVRSAAARSLEYIENPRAKTLNALMSVLKGDDDEIGMAALNTLMAYVGREPYASKGSRLIIKKLKPLAKSGQLHPNTQAVLRNFLTDQLPPDKSQKTIP